MPENRGVPGAEAAAAPSPAEPAPAGPAPRDRAEQEQYIQHLFDSIARHYDLMNMIMSAGALRYWQRVFRRMNGVRPGDHVLDVACGTGELSRIMAEQVGPEGHVWGIDLSPGMIEVGRRKLAAAGLAGRVTLQVGNALDLPFEDNRFDCVATSFALRNMADIRAALREMARVTRPGGRVVCLELSHPPNPLIRYPYQWYFNKVVPWLGRWNERRFKLAGRMSPYRWLPESLRRFPDQEGLAQIFREAGLVDITYRNLTAGIVCLHVGAKPPA